VHGLPHPDAHADSVPGNVLKALRVAPASRKPAQEKEIAAVFVSWRQRWCHSVRALIAATNARDYLLDSLPSMPVSRSVAPRPIRVLPRGNWMDDSGEIVEPGVPAFLRQIVPRRQAGFAAGPCRVVGAADNPLTARTFVNRVWRIFFGEGLTRTLEDLGSQGEWPSHPELLDWLAVDFRANGWDVKRLVRLIVTSRAYQQASRADPATVERDPTNRLLARQNHFRLEAELVRDMALSVSGLLVDRPGGPSAKPYQPAGYYAALNFPRREYGAGYGRRPVAPGRLHALAAHVPPAKFRGLRRAFTRRVHREPVLVQHAAASPRAPERPQLRRSRSGAGRAHHAGRGTNLRCARGLGF
jgi:hypothetical protein